MFCAHCGTPCREDEVFCAHCGAALQTEGGRKEEEAPAPPAPSAEKPAAEPAAAPAVPERRFSLPRLSRRGWLLLGGGCAAALVVAVAVLAGADRPAEGFQAGPAPLVRIESLDETGSEYFYYNGELLAGPEAGLIGFPKFLNDESCLAMDTDGALTAVVTADGVVELDLPEGSMSAYAASADGSTLYCATAKNLLWRIDLPGGAPELVAEDCPVDQLRVSPSGDTAAYCDRNTDGWYLVRKGGKPEELPLPADAVVSVLSDDGRYVYYLANSNVTSGTSAVLEMGGYLYCWDGSASHLVGYTDSFYGNVWTNRTGDQLFLTGTSASYVVDGTESWCFHGVLYPTFLLQGQNMTSGIYTDRGAYVLNCADLTQCYFASERQNTVYRLERGAFTPVLEEVFPEQMRTDATGEILWYTQGGGLWQFRDGKPSLQCDDPGTNVYLKGVSPDGTTVIYESGVGLWRLKAGGEPELLSENVSNVSPYWKGFYYGVHTELWYAPWDGEPEELEELNGISTFDPFSTIQMPDGSTWHLIDGLDPIRVEEGS